MPLSFCPACKRAFDGDACFACGYETPEVEIDIDIDVDDLATRDPADELERGFFDSPVTNAGDKDVEAPAEVIEDLPLSELLQGVASLREQVRIIGEALELEGRFTEARTLERALEVLANPQLVIVEGGAHAEGIGTDVQDGDERIRDESAVVETLDLGELLQGKKRLSSKVGYIADALTDEGRVGEAAILLRMKLALERLDAAKSELDGRL